MNAEYFDRKGYLLVKVNVPWTIEAALQLLDETKKEALNREYHLILFDLTQWSSPGSEMVRFYTGEHLAKVLNHPFKVAAFAEEKNINHFGEVVAINRGAFFRIFADEQSAIQWLMEDSSEAPK